jgi:radical SAM superfamily enzyme YgiQ (UPF0313 family)
MSLSRTINRRLEAELGAAPKEHGGRLRVALAFPNTYYVGMSNLGFQAVYHLLNRRPDVVCERAFLPDPEDLASLARTRRPLVSYESQTPLAAFDLVGFSLPFELDYVNAVTMLRLARLSPLRAERAEADPLLLGGGPGATLNPEPLAELFDAFLIGEAEPVLDLLVEEIRRSPGDKAGLLRSLPRIPGVYVPSLYQFGFEGAKTVAPLPSGGAPARIERQFASPLDAWPTHSRLLTRETEFGRMFLVEIARGCGRACRFCAVHSIYWPLRRRSLANLLSQVERGLELRDTIGLVSAAVSDYPQIDQLAARICDLGGKVSVSSLRADSASQGLTEALARSRAQVFTLAPEAGTERLRAALHKAISDDQIISAARLAAGKGIPRVKLYFMVGLPGETQADIDAIPRLARQVLRAARPRQMVVSACGFVPKPGTPLEREAMAPPEEMRRKLGRIRDALKGEPRVRLRFESPGWTLIQGLLSRGDRRLGRRLARIAERGNSLSAWRQELRSAQLSEEDICRSRPEEELLPWEHLEGGRAT